MLYFLLQSKVSHCARRVFSFASQTDIVRLLLSQRADSNAMDAESSTPLHFASLKGHVEVGKITTISIIQCGVIFAVDFSVSDCYFKLVPRLIDGIPLGEHLCLMLAMEVTFGL